MGVQFQDIRISGYEYVYYMFDIDALCTLVVPLNLPDILTPDSCISFCNVAQIHAANIFIWISDSGAPKYQSKTLSYQRCVNDIVSYFIINMHP